LSALKSATKSQFNDVDLAKFKTDALLVGDEVAKILSGGGSGSPTSDAKLQQAISLFKTSDSVPAIAATVEEVQALLANRRKALVRGTYLDKPDVKADSVTPQTAADFLEEAGYDVQR
jgi:predicted TIM-barrel enzyme